jgi:hypothetical protein
LTSWKLNPAGVSLPPVSSPLSPCLSINSRATERALDADSAGIFALLNLDVVVTANQLRCENLTELTP